MIAQGPSNVTCSLSYTSGIMRFISDPSEARSNETESPGTQKESRGQRKQAQTGPEVPMGPVGPQALKVTPEPRVFKVKRRDPGAAGPAGPPSLKLLRRIQVKPRPRYLLVQREIKAIGSGGGLNMSPLQIATLSWYEMYKPTSYTVGTYPWGSALTAAISGWRTITIIT